MIKDASQKDMLYRHFRAQDWYALVEVPIFYRGGVEERPRLVTDVDVLGIRPSSDLCWEYIIGDCKTKRSESPANRTMWVRALIDQFRAHRAIVILKREQAIEADHKLFAHVNNVTLVEESDFDAFDRAMIFPGGSGEFPETVDQLKLLREQVPFSFPRLTPLTSYINGTAWNEPDHLTMMRKALAAGRSVRREIEPANLEHLLLAMEAAGVFAVGFATCVGAIFHQYLQPNNSATLDQAIKVLIWGGRENYDHLSGLRTQLADAKGVVLDDTGLALPEWPGFMQLVSTHLAAPKLAFRVPQLLRSLALDLLAGREPLMQFYPRDLMLIKFAMQTAAYFVQAAGFPPDTRVRIKQPFLDRIGELTTNPSHVVTSLSGTPLRTGVSPRNQSAASDSPTGSASEIPHLPAPSPTPSGPPYSETSPAVGTVVASARIMDEKPVAPTPATSDQVATKATKRGAKLRTKAIDGPGGELREPQ